MRCLQTNPVLGAIIGKSLRLHDSYVTPQKDLPEVCCANAFNKKKKRLLTHFNSKHRSHCAFHRLGSYLIYIYGWSCYSLNWTCTS